MVSVAGRQGHLFFWMISYLMLRLVYFLNEILDGNPREVR